LGITGVHKAYDRDITQEAEENDKKPKEQRIGQLEKRTCSISIRSSPLEKYVTLPDKLKEIKYSNAIAGAVRGALETVS